MEFDLELSTGRLRVLRSGSFKHRPVILFLHDSLGCIRLWKDFPQKLGEMSCCNILVYDRQGYGRSMPFTDLPRKTDYLEKEADVLSELLEKCKIDQAILFGHSDGGSIALIFAAKYPARVLGIITEGAHIFAEEVSLKGIRDAVSAYQTTDLKSRLEIYHGDKTEDMFRAWADTWLSDEFRSWSMENFLPAIGCPVLIIQGEEDEFGTVKQVDGIASKIKGLTVKLMIPGVKHTPHKEIPERIIQAASEFTRKFVTMSIP